MNKIVKNLMCKENGRSSDYITPSFILGCSGTCNFCYVHRNNWGLQIAENVNEILQSIDKQSINYKKKTPNQCDYTYWIQDIGCNTDVCLHWKNLDWIKVFDFYKNHPTLKATFATKWVREECINYNPGNKVRMRYSMLPQEVADIAMPKMSTNLQKIDAANRAVENGWEIHWNFSPVIIKDSWLKEYRELFQLINDLSSERLKNQWSCEVIFLTHSEKLHNFNVSKNVKGEELLWTPKNQENKVSTYGGDNIRYNYKVKSSYISEFKRLINKELDIKIRYIF
jgi:spore photoproduct lyase